MRAATAYMPKVGGQMMTSIVLRAAEAAHQQVDGLVAAAPDQQLRSAATP